MSARASRRSPRRLGAAVLASGLLTGALAGCGSGGDPKPASETLPTCADVWVAGETLPADYAGCQAEDGALQVSNAQTCTKRTGQQKAAFVTFGASFYALTGEVIHQGAFDTTEYDELYAGCFGQQW
ncbi:MAG: hypothetical protein R2731_05985 [Nocardioides sp.]